MTMKLTRWLTRMTKQVLRYPSIYREDKRDQYVHEFETLNNLKHHPVEWITPVDGNYA